jgi:hypothetical protein
MKSISAGFLPVKCTTSEELRLRGYLGQWWEQKTGLYERGLYE